MRTASPPASGRPPRRRPRPPSRRTRRPRGPARQMPLIVPSTRPMPATTTTRSTPTRRDPGQEAPAGWSAGRHRRRGRLRPPGLGARPRGPRPRATASTSPTGSSRCCPSGCPTASVLPARGREPRLPWPCGWCSAPRAASAAHRLRARPDALGRQALLRAGPGRHRRRPRRQDRPAGRDRWPAIRCWAGLRRR